MSVSAETYHRLETAWMLERSARATLEDVLAVTAENLLAYRDYYGTTIAQVKHLQECTQCWTPESTSLPVRCPDYPTE